MRVKSCSTPPLSSLAKRTFCTVGSKIRNTPPAFRARRTINSRRISRKTLQLAHFCFVLTTPPIQFCPESRVDSGLHLNEERKKVGWNKRGVSGRAEHAGTGLRPYPGLRLNRNTRHWRIRCSGVSTSKLCAKTTPFDFTACGGYAQGERQKSQQPQGPFVLSPSTNSGQAARQRSRSTGELAVAPTHRFGVDTLVACAGRTSPLRALFFCAHGARYCIKAQVHECPNLLWSDLESRVSRKAES